LSKAVGEAVVREDVGALVGDNDHGG
jgi:hypothetical protein